MSNEHLFGPRAHLTRVCNEANPWYCWPGYHYGVQPTLKACLDVEIVRLGEYLIRERREFDLRYKKKQTDFVKEFPDNHKGFKLLRPMWKAEKREGRESAVRHHRQAVINCEAEYARLAQSPYVQSSW